MQKCDSGPEYRQWIRGGVWEGKQEVLLTKIILEMQVSP